jgi:ribosomal protein S18 acetylase RimI-like enzyme
MISNRVKKIVIIMSIALAACSGVGAYHYYQSTQGPIYDFNPATDTQPILDIFKQNWYWLIANPGSSPAFMMKHRTFDTNPIHFGALKFKVLREGDKLAGFTAYYMETPTQGRLLFLAVDHKFRGKRYGQMLARRAMNELFKMGAEHIALWTRTDNLPAQRIYKELGFVEIFDEDGFICFEYYPNGGVAAVS